MAVAVAEQSLWVYLKLQLGLVPMGGQYVCQRIGFWDISYLFRGQTENRFELEFYVLGEYQE